MDNSLTTLIRAKDDGASTKIRNYSSQIERAGKQHDSFSSKLKKASLAVAAVGVGLTAYSKMATNANIDYVKSVTGVARITGESVEQTSRLQYVLQRSGISAQQSTTIFGVFQKQISATNEAVEKGSAAHKDIANKIEAAKIKIKEINQEIKKNGDESGKYKNQVDSLNISISKYKKELGEAKTPLQKLGIETKTAKGESKSFSAILLEVADRFKALPDGAKKTTLSMQLFGRSGKDLIKVLNQGSDGIQKLEEQADKLGITITTSNIEAVSKYVAVQKQLKDAQQAFTLAIGQTALPMWQRLADAQIWAVSTFNALPDAVKVVTANIIAFGGPVLSAAGAVAGFAGNVGSAIPVLMMLKNAISGPWMLALGAAITIVTAIVGTYIATTNSATIAQQRQKAAADSLKLANQGLNDSQLALTNAKLSSRQASLAVESAEIRLKDAIARYGRGSLEARQATLDLERAKQDVKNADNQVKKAVDATTEALKRQKDALNAVKDADSRTARSQINNINSIANVAEARRGSLGVKQYTVPLLAPRGTGGNIFTKPIGRNASGTTWWPGGRTLVGENGPEIIDAPKGSRIHNKKQTEDIMSNGQIGGGVNNFNISVSVTVENDGTSFTDSQAVGMAHKIADALRSQGLKGLNVADMRALR